MIFRVILIIIYTFFSLTTLAQLNLGERVNLILDMHTGIGIYKLNGLDYYEIRSKEDYDDNGYIINKKIDTTSVIGMMGFKMGANVLLNPEHSKILYGAEFNVGVKFSFAIKAAEGMHGAFFLDYPLYAFVKFPLSSFHRIGVYGGYSFVRGPIRHNIGVGAIEFEVIDYIAIRYSFTLINDIYYTYYSNGHYEPAITISDHMLEIRFSGPINSVF